MKMTNEDASKETNDDFEQVEETIKREEVTSVKQATSVTTIKKENADE